MTSATIAIAAKVRGVAAEHRFSQKRIADTLGLSRTTVVERINGRVPFTATEILSLAIAMDVSPDRFFPEPREIERASAALAADGSRVG